MINTNGETGGHAMEEMETDATHLLHGELFEDRVIFVEPQLAEPVQDPVLLRCVGLRLGQRLGTGLGV